MTAMPAGGNYRSAMDPTDILLTDQVAVVTGAGAGIGQGIALGLARFGADVAVVDVDADRAEITAARIRESGRAALTVTADMSDAEQARGAIAAAKEHFGTVDILVNNVGGVKKQDFVQQTERSMRRHVDLNLSSMMIAVHEVLPIMIDSGRGGSIVNVASIEALRAAPGFAVYSACKAGMMNFGKSLALEVGHHGIRVNTLAPDIIATPGIRGIVFGPVPETLPEISAEQQDGVDRYVPLLGEGTPDDCAGAAVFLCSKMARYISGATISIDGGTLASAGWRRTAVGSSEWDLFSP